MNTAALASMRLRTQGHRRTARLLSTLGYGTVLGSAYLGGHLVFRQHVGADHSQMPEASDFVPVLDEKELSEDAPRLAHLGDVRIVLVRHRGDIYALTEHCSHMGGPLSEGVIEGDKLVCPWHASGFCLRDGQPLDGPASAPQPTLEVRVKDGVIEVRSPPCPGEEGEVLRRRGGEKALTWKNTSVETWLKEVAPNDPRRVLVEDHQLFRRLFRDLRSVGREDPQRRSDLFHQLASQLEIHEMIEEEIFYPAVQQVSWLSAPSRFEHRVLGEVLVRVASEDPATEAFEQRLDYLEKTLEHHAQIEEREMFRHAELLDEAVRAKLGEDLRRRRRELERDRLHQAVRELKLTYWEKL